MPYTHDMQTSQVASSFAFTLTGVRNKPVRITKIKAVVDSREPLPEGTVYYAIPQGAVGREDFAIDFGSDDLDARVQNDDGVPTATHYLDHKTVTLAKNESIGFNVVAVAPFYGINLTYHLEITFDGGANLKIYDTAGHSFRIMSYPMRATRGYITVKDGPDNPDNTNYAIYPCTWPDECQHRALGDWPYKN